MLSTDEEAELYRRLASSELAQEQFDRHIAGYRIVWRETTAPYWQQRRDVGNVTRYTLKALSKDDYIFGVVAMDKDGNESVASYPKPYRPASK